MPCVGNSCSPRYKGGVGPVAPRGTGRRVGGNGRPMPAPRGVMTPGIPATPGMAPSPIPMASPAPAPVVPPTSPAPVTSGLDALTGPGFTQRNIQIPQPNSIEAFKYGTPGMVQQFPRFAPEQEAAMRSLLGYGVGGIGNTNLDFQPIADQARKQFKEQTVPGLAERFNILGGGGRSSAQEQGLLRAGSDLESNLAALQSQYNLNKVGALGNLSRLGLEPAYETTYFPAQPGALQTFAQGAANAIAPATELGLKAAGSALSSWWNSGGAQVAASNPQQAAQQIAQQIPQDLKQQIVSGGFERFKNAIWPTLIGAAGGALGAFPLGPAAIFAALLGGGLGLASYLTS